MGSSPRGILRGCRRRTVHTVDGAALTAVCCLVTVLLIMRSSGIRPFGARSNVLGDAGAQYLEFYAVFRDIITGSDLSSAQFSWALGAGVPFLPAYATYLGGPFTFLVALFPANRISTAMTVIVVAKLMAASAAMFALLRTLGPRRHPVAACLAAVAYATCTWVIEMGWSNLQWLDGLIAFPALCLVALRCRSSRRRIWPGALVVALFWWSNFYSAYMASLGAAIFFAVLEAASSTSLRRSAVRIGRFALAGALGVALTSPILIPTLTALRNGSPTPGSDLTAVRWSSILVRLLPMTEGIVTPALFCSSAALLVVLGIPAAFHLTRRARIAIAVAAAVLLISLKVPALLLVWNAFQTPHGMPFRCAFVVSGLMIVTAHTAWPPRRLRPRATAGSVALRSAVTTSLAWPGPLAWASSAALYAVISRTVDRLGEPLLFIDPAASVSGWFVLAVGLATSVVAMIATARGGLTWRRIRATTLVLATVSGIGVSVQENLANSQYVNNRLRTWSGELLPRASQDATRLQVAAAATRTAGWPEHRVNINVVGDDPIWSRINASARYSFPGINYYSTTVESATSRPLVTLGYGARNGGRTLYRPQDEVLSTLLAAYDPQSRFDPLPMVRTVRAVSPQADLPADMAARDELLGARIYSSPTLYRVTATGTEPITSPHAVPAGTDQDVRITCPAGHYVITHESFRGTTLLIRKGGTSTQVAESGEFPRKRIVGQHVLVERSDGTPTTITFRADDGGTSKERIVDPNGLGCLDPAPLQEQITSTASSSSIGIAPSRVRAEFSIPQTGRLVVATTAANGWSCRVDERPAAIRPLAGMLAVDASGARRIDCVYRPPGLNAGIAVGAVSLLAIALITIAQRRRSRRGEE